jgi:hypothetical protein
MPIKPENKDLYPENWAEIRQRILTRAKNCCEVCGIRNYSVGYRDEQKNFVPCSGNVTMEDYGQGINPNTGKPLTPKEASEMAKFQTDNDEMGYKYFVIILTIAHKDHDPGNCAEENLFAGCQKCHNNYDIPHRKQTRIESKYKGNLKIAWTENSI